MTRSRILGRAAKRIVPAVGVTRDTVRRSMRRGHPFDAQRFGRILGLAPSGRLEVLGKTAPDFSS